MFGIDDMAVAGGLSALANFGGGLMGSSSASQVNAQQMASQRDANFANLSFARDQMDNQNAWNRVSVEMANSAYQRAMIDMKKAGLNPILAYKMGGDPQATFNNAGMSAGQSGVSGLQNPGEHMGKGIANAVSSAVDAAKTVQGVKLMEEQVKSQKTQQELQANQAKAALAAASRDEAAATASAAQAAKTAAETSQIVPAMAASHNASAAASSATAAAVNQDARRKLEFGDSVLGNQLNTIQQVGKRVLQWLDNRKATGEEPAPVSPPSASGPAPLLRDDPTHWLYKRR